MTASPVPADSILLDYGLRAQARLFPYVLGFFGVGMPLFLWAAKASVSPGLMAFYILMLAAVWPAFLVLRNRSERLAESNQSDGVIRARLLRQGVGGGLWALCLTLISLTAGSDAGLIQTICAGAAVGLLFFSSPVLLHLLTIGPAALTGPILVMYGMREQVEASQLIAGGLVLAFAMALVLNRHMREHYTVQHQALTSARQREAANAARVALMETLSREVRTGLRGIEQNLSQGLVSLTRAPAPRRHVETALDEVNRLKTILVTTLDNDDAEAGQITVERKPLDIALICERVVAGFATLAHTKDLTLSLTLPETDHPGAPVGDARRVEQIVEHLVSNALQYTQTGRVEVRVARNGDHVRIEVIDSGPGLTAGELEQAFAPHLRVARTSAGYPGAGLGLSLCRSLAVLMQGRLAAQSTPDVGSKFWLDLPWDVFAVRPERSVDKAESADDSIGCLRVLLLANDSLRAAQLRDQLEDLGHRCLTSTSRERALALAEKGGLDACVISTGAFEDLHDEGNREQLSAFLEGLRATQNQVRLNIVALLPEGDQAADLQSMGVIPLILPQSREGLARALSVSFA